MPASIFFWGCLGICRVNIMDKQEALEIARIQLTFLIAALPEACAGSAGLAGAMTVLKDADGVDMLVRVRLLSAQGEGVGYADISIVPELGSVVLSIAQGVEWDEGAIRSKIEDQGFDSSGSFIAYAYPRVGLEISGGS